MKIGMMELLVILVIAIVVFGSGRIARLGEDLGKAVKSFKKGMDEAEDAAKDTKDV